MDPKKRLRASEAKRIPPTLDYLAIPSLRAETRQKLAKVRPETLGQAARTRVSAFSMEAMVEAYVRLWRASVPGRA